MSYRTHAQINAETALCAQARRSAAFLVKQRARAYAKRPMTLETLCPGLATASSPNNACSGETFVRDGTPDAPPVVRIWWRSSDSQCQGRPPAGARPPAGESEISGGVSA